MRLPHRVSQSLALGVIVGGSGVIGGCSSGDKPGSSVAAMPGAHESNGDRGDAEPEPQQSDMPDGEASVADEDGAAGSAAPNDGEGGGPSGDPGDDSGAGGTSGTELPQAMPEAGPADPGTEANDPACPPSWAEAFPYQTPQCSPSGLICSYALDCTSGTQVLELTCVDEKWDGATGCEHPYDFCEKAVGSMDPRDPQVICNESWSIEDWARGIADGVGPCPEEQPDDGGRCVTGGTGGVDRRDCGYPCADDPEKWTIISCVGEGDDTSWSTDGACD